MTAVVNPPFVWGDEVEDLYFWRPKINLGTDIIRQVMGGTSGSVPGLMAQGSVIQPMKRKLGYILAALDIKEMYSASRFSESHTGKNQERHCFVWTDIEFTMDVVIENCDCVGGCTVEGSHWNDSIYTTYCGGYHFIIRCCYLNDDGSQDLIDANKLMRLGEIMSRCMDHVDRQLMSLTTELE